MDCIQCKIANPDDNRYCGKCGAELGHTLDETVRRKGFRDRQATEMEITEAIVERLMKWSKWLGSAVAVIVGLFAILLGFSYHDVRSGVHASQAEMEKAVNEGKAEINQAKQAIPGLKSEIGQLQSDADKYKQVNQHIAKLQDQLTKVKNDVVDLGNKELKVKTLITSGSGPSSLFFGNLGCPTSLEKNQKIMLCAQGSPPVFYELTRTGLPLRPVASLSTIGFQDTSTGKKPDCTSGNRGTFYVEKGAGNSADKPFVCVRNSNDTYAWLELSVTQ
jgi:hypothetical protein